jgi:phage tail-like protein
MSDQYQSGYNPSPQQDPQQQQQYPQQPQQQYQQQPPQQQQYMPQNQPAQSQHQPAQSDWYQQQSVQQQQQPSQNVQVTDSLSSNEFIVEINGERISGIFAVTGLSSYKLRMEDGKPVGMDFPPIVITKMVQQNPDLIFNQWTRETVAARGTRLPTRDISIVAMDEGIETRRWVYRNCWISGIEFSDFDTALDFLIEERITIQHGGVEEIWPQ